jgi:uncharacterized membrane protein YdjX (TVP38/TMEM64 family)
MGLLRVASELPRGVVLLGSLVGVTLTVCALALLQGWVDAATLARLVQRSGSLGMLAYVAAVVVAELLWFPRAWGLLAGGVLFGPLVGGALSLVGDMAGALLCYALARTAARGWVEGLLARRPRAAQVVELLARRQGAVTVALMRVCPIAHYTLVSYAAGLAGVRPRSFALGNLVGLLPAAALYPLLGHAAWEPASPLFWGSLLVIAAFLAGTLVAARRVWRQQGQSPERRAGEEQP